MYTFRDAKLELVEFGMLVSADDLEAYLPELEDRQISNHFQNKY